jgi:DMSO/TMAO reductase YedYZ molybdopterin-dependent catalytic subunit
MSKFAIIVSAIIGAVVLASVGLLSACSPGDGMTTTTPPTATELEGVEVREYEGELLSPISEFRENSIKGPQYIKIEDYELQVNGLVATPVAFTYDEVVGEHDIFKKVVRLHCVEGWVVNILWEGVMVNDLLAAAGPLPEAKTVIFHAYDGYTTSFPIEYFEDNDILMAYKMNDITIPPERGFPFQLVAESKWGYKWIKWITQIELSDDTNYRGYWESRGYADEGDLDKSFID